MGIICLDVVCNVGNASVYRHMRGQFGEDFAERTRTPALYTPTGDRPNTRSKAQGSMDDAATRYDGYFSMIKGISIQRETAMQLTSLTGGLPWPTA